MHSFGRNMQTMRTVGDASWQTHTAEGGEGERGAGVGSAGCCRC